MAVAYVCSDTLTGIRTPLCRTSLAASLLGASRPRSLTCGLSPRPFCLHVGYGAANGVEVTYKFVE